MDAEGKTLNSPDPADRGKGLTIRRSHQPVAMVVELIGSADMDSSTTLAEEFVQLADADDQRLIVDLAGLDFLSSTGIGALVRAHGAIRQRNGRMILAAPQPSVARLFEITRLGDLLTIVNSRDEAVNLLKP